MYAGRPLPRFRGVSAASKAVLCAQATRKAELSGVRTIFCRGNLGTASTKSQLPRAWCLATLFLLQWTKLEGAAGRPCTSFGVVMVHVFFICFFFGLLLLLPLHLEQSFFSDHSGSFSNRFFGF